MGTRSSLRACRSNQPQRHLDFGCLASRTLRGCVSVVLNHPVLVLEQLLTTNTPGLTCLLPLRCESPSLSRELWRCPSSCPQTIPRAPSNCWALRGALWALGREKDLLGFSCAILSVPRIMGSCKLLFSVEKRLQEGSSAALRESWMLLN